MLSFLFKKEHRVEALIYDYLETVERTHENFLNALTACIDNPFCENFEFFIDRTHKYESKADDIREEIKTLMYGKTLIPDARGDIMGLLEAIDTIPRLFERILYIIQTQKLEIPDFLIPDLKDLVRLSLECCELMRRQVVALFKKNESIRELLNIIDTHESHCDRIERRMITKIFESGITPFLKLQLKDLTVQIGEISDQADRVSKRINIINMKRRV
ncbi:MAG: DUF47 domain-containing protein [Deltaproteobacteria bacterium]|nr:DUF47 domain-containing protein [Deltaproteobacteria bacterium]MBW2040570.1 DUF47 domain-containing protein [Deltaproteobacteria bacterium]MBW2131437.1 DUF47 domain-containing protein [Deltaproteobacteria bacterium]